jgi:hypothetical protein
MKYFLCFLCASLLSNNSHAEFYDLSEEETLPQAEEILIKKPEKFLRHESMIYDLDTELGIEDQRRYTGSDINRFSLAAHLSANYEQLTDILGFEVNYMRRSTRYNQFFYGAQFFQHKTYFDTISQNASGAGGVNTESSFKRPGNVKNTVLGFGLGMGYRFKLLLDFYPTEDVFETIDVFLNSIQLTENYIGKTYRGPGLSTNYGLHKRSGNNFIYGAKISYNVASVTRSAITNERKSSRSLSLGWLSFGLEIGFYY